MHSPGTFLLTLILFTASLQQAHAAELQRREALAPDGVTISYREGGRGATTLVFIHGWTCDSGYWREQLPVFADDYRIIAVDLAGHGASGLGRESYSMESFGADVAAVAQGSDPVVLIGHSMGGPVMLQAALLLGERVKGLVGVDTLRAVASSKESREALEAQVAPLEEDYAAVAGKFLDSMFLAASDATLRQEITADMLATDRRVGVDALRGMLRMDVGAALEATEAPLILINSDYLPTDIEAVRQRHADTTLYAMNNVGHFVMLEDAATFNELLRRALDTMLR